MTSAPASTARTAVSAVKEERIPAMSSPSVTIRPEKPRSCRRTSTIGEDRVAGARGGIEGGGDDVARHHPVDTRFHCAPERQKLDRVQPLAGPLDGGELQMAVGGGVSVAGKVFGRGEESSRARPFHEARGQVRDQGRVFAEGTDVDDGVVGIVVDVGDGRERPVHAQRPALPRGHFAGEARGLSRSASPRGPWRRAAAPPRAGCGRPCPAPCPRPPGGAPWPAPGARSGTSADAPPPTRTPRPCRPRAAPPRREAAAPAPSRTRARGSLARTPIICPIFCRRVRRFRVARAQSPCPRSVRFGGIAGEGEDADCRQTQEARGNHRGKPKANVPRHRILGAAALRLATAFPSGPGDCSRHPVRTVSPCAHRHSHPASGGRARNVAEDFLTEPPQVARSRATRARRRPRPRPPRPERPGSSRSSRPR